MSEDTAIKHESPNENIHSSHPDQSDDQWIVLSFYVTISFVALFYIILPALSYMSLDEAIDISNISEENMIASLIFSQVPILAALLIVSYLSASKLSFTEKFRFQNWKWKFIIIPFGVELCLLPIAAIITSFIQIVSSQILEADLPPQLIQSFALECSNQTFVIMAISAVIIAPILEEIMFRKIIFDFLKGKSGEKVALIISSALFAGVHATLLITPVLFILAVVLQKLYIKYNSLYPCIILHIVHNALAFGMLSYLK